MKPLETSLRTTEINLPDPQSVKDPLSHLINTIPRSSPGPPQADAKALINADRPGCAGSPGCSGLMSISAIVCISQWGSGAGSGSNGSGGEFSEAAEQTGGPQPNPARLQPPHPWTLPSGTDMTAWMSMPLKPTCCPALGSCLICWASPILPKVAVLRQLSFSEGWSTAGIAWKPLLPACPTPSSH